MGITQENRIVTSLPSFPVEDDLWLDDRTGWVYCFRQDVWVRITNLIMNTKQGIAFRWENGRWRTAGYIPLTAKNMWELDPHVPKPIPADRRLEAAQDAIKKVDSAIEEAASILPELGEHNPGWSMLEDARCTNTDCRQPWPCPTEKIRRLHDDLRNINRPRD